MYLSNSDPILIEERTKNQRTDVISRLYGMEFNLIPMNGKKPCIEWKPFQTRRITPAEIKEWMSGRFSTKDGNNSWKAEILNFALVTGAVSWSDDNPGIVVIDSDDEEAEALVERCCPDTPMKQRTGSGGGHRIYRRPPNQEIAYIPEPTEDVVQQPTIQSRCTRRWWLHHVPRFDSSENRRALSGRSTVDAGTADAVPGLRSNLVAM